MSRAQVVVAVVMMSLGGLVGSQSGQILQAGLDAGFGRTRGNARVPHLEQRREGDGPARIGDTVNDAASGPRNPKNVPKGQQQIAPGFNLGETGHKQPNEVPTGRRKSATSQFNGTVAQ